ncbi:membrane protein [Shewanella sp. NFH-SH190041]|uniref:DUF4056 domain-containing protein n=1 Tax=Shewanella sp. NFH-SH190041 TaxID=2950245 RepID=UPI0021C43906|nr:DUF4056 domain-containing protein [Shewanella sp. NFH-SH190041]BDM64204.1 membrane protein [Shewanella sp. NFH-SH190041]
MIKFTHLLSIAILAGNMHLALAIEPPTGIRPCCAFGVDLTVAIGRLPVPFFSLNNVLSIDELGHHRYNNGDLGVIGHLLGMSDENNGLLYTRLGGFIDSAHVRDTADYTYYLYQKLWPYIGEDHSLMLSDELRQRQVVLYGTNKVLDDVSKQQQGIKIAGLIAFKLAQWHEIAQWFGLISVAGWSEFSSAFSPEDLYSNMLGARLAMQVLALEPSLDVQAFSQVFEQHFAQTLILLEVQSKAITRQYIKSLDGHWWDSKKRLPDKWILHKRDYDLSLSLSPHSAAIPLQMRLDNSQQAELRLLPADNEKAFNLLPDSLKKRPYWRDKDFQDLADFARDQDTFQRVNIDSK